MTDQLFPAKLRIKLQADFRRVHSSSVYAADQFLVIRGAPNGLAYARLGLSISRQVGNAVVRNRWKRLIRESFRLLQAELPAGIDFVVRPRRGARPEFHAIHQALPRLTKRIAQSLHVRGRKQA